MKQENAIEVQGVKKKFKVFYDKGSQLKEKLLFKNRNRYEERWVLKGIDFEVKKGEAIGLIGHNGCGKSTTLKLLTKIIYPDSGSIQMRGRVSSLIELGAGFHPDMSGRENIYTNASIFGLTRKEIDARMDDIIEFSEMEEFLDNPVRTYSSGMYMRLAFSVAINVDADILLIDEILAVGDVNFQAKCFNRLREIKKKGTTIVIVSHSLGQIEQICDRTIWIHDGLIKKEGTPRTVHPEYLDFMGNKRQEIAEKESERKEKKEKDTTKQKTEKEKKEKNEEKEIDKKIDKNIQEDITAEADKEQKKRWGNGKARITKILVYNSQKKEQSVFATGDKVCIEIQYKVKEEVKDAVVGVGIFRSDGIHCYGTNTRVDNLPEYALKKDGIVEIEIEEMNLLPGKYFVDIAIESELGVPIDYYREATEFQMYSVISDIGVSRINHSWKFQNIEG